MYFSPKYLPVVDIPSPKYLHCLEHHEAFNTFLNTSKELEVVVHFSPPHIFDSSGYGRFLGRTMAHRHLVLNENNKYSGLFDVHRRQAQCHQLNHEIFPLLRYIPFCHLFRETCTFRNIPVLRWTPIQLYLMRKMLAMGPFTMYPPELSIFYAIEVESNMRWLLTWKKIWPRKVAQKYLFRSTTAATR